MQWFDENKDKEQLNKDVLKKAQDLFSNMDTFREDARRYFKMIEYKNYSTKDEKKLMADGTNEEDLLDNPYLTLNLTASCCETVSNKIAKIKPKVTFLTKTSSRQKRELAGKLDIFILKIFKKGRVWKKASRAFKSASVSGLGIIKVSVKDNKLKFYKIPVFDFFCDNAHTGKNYPTVAGETKVLSIDELKKMFPSKEKTLVDNYEKKQRIKVWEIYKKYKKQIIFTDKVILSEKNWDKPLPYAFLKWEEADQGVISVGIPKKLYAIQNSIAYILGKTFRSIKNFAVPRVFISKGANPTVLDISNAVGQIIEVNDQEGGKTPQFSTPPATNNQVIEILLMLWQKGFEIIGVSELSAGGKIPRGLEKASGAALRSYQQVESERFQLIRSDYEDFFCDLAKLIFKIIPDKMLPDGVKRKDIEDLKDDITVWTSSLLPDTPAGKLALVTDFFNIGLVSGAEAIDLIDSPDIGAYSKSETARLKAVDILIDRALDKLETPIYYPALGLDLYLDRARKKFAEMIMEESEENKKTILQAFVKSLEEKVMAKTDIQNTIQGFADTGPSSSSPPPLPPPPEAQY